MARQKSTDGVYIWLAVDRQCGREKAEQYGYAGTKETAEAIVSKNRGYDDPAEAIAEGWMIAAVKLLVQPVVARSLIAFGETFK